MMTSRTMKRKMNMEENVSMLGSSCRRENVILGRLSSLNHQLVANTVLKSVPTIQLKQFSITRTTTLIWRLRDQSKRLNSILRMITLVNGSMS